MSYYIYSLVDDIYARKVDLQNHIINSNKEKPVRTSYIKIQSEAIEQKARAISDICDAIDNNRSDILNKIDIIEDKDKARQGLEVYFS